MERGTGKQEHIFGMDFGLTFFFFLPWARTHLSLSFLCPLPLSLWPLEWLLLNWRCDLAGAMANSGDVLGTLTMSFGSLLSAHGLLGPFCRFPASFVARCISFWSFWLSAISSLGRGRVWWLATPNLLRAEEKDTTECPHCLFSFSVRQGLS